MTYTFPKQLAIGTVGETKLDRFFSEWYMIEPATPEQQRTGIDRIFIRKSDHTPITIEYKTDYTAGRTGNAFIETVSVDTVGVPGWAYTSKARYLIYHIPDPETIYVVPMAIIRANVDAWRLTYPERRIPNKSSRGTRYNTVGLLLPLDELEKIAIQTY